MSASTEAVAATQAEAMDRTGEFLRLSEDASDPRDAADWALAAKNTLAVAVSCETIMKVRVERARLNGARR